MDFCTITYDLDCETIIPSIIWLETKDIRFQDLSAKMFEYAILFIQVCIEDSWVSTFL